MLLITQPQSDRSTSTEAVPSERRRGLRIHQNRPLKVFEPTTGRYFGGQTCDISSTGLRIELPASMPVHEGHVVTIHVGLDGKGQALANRRAMIPARVVWMERSFDGSNRPMVMAGVEFVSSIAAHLDAA
jgi:hypothetical protein